jgi:hypothetical protein
MRASIDSVREESSLQINNRTKAIVGAVLMCSASFFAALGQIPSSPTRSETQSSISSTASQDQTVTARAEATGFAAAVKNVSHGDSGLDEDQIKQLLVGKTFFLRGAYLDNTLDFDEHGNLAGSSPRGSYTLCAIKINRAKFSKRKVQLEGDRYALHFLGELPHQDPLKDVDRVKITPKKKIVKITINREQVEKPKKQKHKNKQQDISILPVAQVAAASSAPPNPTRPDAAASEQQPISDTPSEGKHFSATTSPAHAAQTLINALDRVLAQEIDNRMIAGMPDFWRLYYKAAATNTDYSSTDPGLYHQSNVDQKAKLISTIEPPSNEFAQSNGVAGLAMYHAIIGSDGKATDIVAGRPIGFGLDESAVDAIHKATFQPAMKDGKPVPVALDLVVSFRIYSNRTSQRTTQRAEDGPAQPVLPGPYSVQRQ